MERREIGFRTVRCALGWLLVAGSEKGVCAVILGDVRGPLVDALRGEFPWADLASGDDRLDGWAVTLAQRAAGGRPDAEVPLDVRGSRFQQRVWAALGAIPRGETRSYGELAGSLGKPRGARAVAGACARNPVALAVPCHRVVGAGGALRGYRWGTARKQALLDQEKEGDSSLSSAGGLASSGGRARRRSNA